MAKKVSINLLISTEMSGRGENDVVRFPMRARNFLSLTGETLRLGRGPCVMEVTIKQAFRKDVVRLGNLRRKGEVSEETSLATGFVSRSTYQRLAAKAPKDQNAWISEESASITIGCDPEFGLVDPNHKVLHRGDQVLPGSKKSPFGADGPGVEVRPPPSTDHIALVASIRDLLEDPPPASKNYLWVGGATFRDKNRTYWFGGHIHLGRPQGIDLGQAEPAFRALARVLDHCIALPLVTFDTPEPFLRRKGCAHHYGIAGDIRTKDGNSRFEYRVPSGLWATHPLLAKIVLGATKAVAEDFYGRSARAGHSPRYFNQYFRQVHKGLGFNLQGESIIANLINFAKPEALSGETMEYWKGLMNSLGTREEYAEEIDALIKLVEHSPGEVLPGLSTHLNENWQRGRPLLLDAPKDLEQALDAVEKKA